VHESRQVPSSKRPRPDWSPIIAVAHLHPGSWASRYREVVAAFDRGELEGERPSYSGFWRRMTREADCPAPVRSNETPTQVPEPTTPDPRPAVVAVMSEAESARSAALRKLKEAETRLNQNAGRLASLGLFTLSDINAQHRLLKKGKPSRLAARDTAGLLRLVQEYDRTAEQYRRRFPDPESPASEESTSSPLAVRLPASGTALGQTSAPHSAAPEVAPQPPALPEPEYRAVIGSLHVTRTVEDARNRARIIIPVLNGFLTPHRCAEMIHQLAVGCTPDQETADLFGLFPASTYWRYRKVSRRTIERWVARVRSEQECAKSAGLPIPSVELILMHQQPDGRESGRKITPEVETLLKDIYKAQPNFSMADVARFVAETHGIQLSVRHVQRILSTRLTELERGHARGGVSADVIFRARLLRDARNPNDTWIGDHSFLRQEHLDPDHPEYVDKVADFDWELDIAVERRNRHGVVSRERRAMHLTMWMDACTRRILSLRVWDAAPDTRKTIASLFDAVRLYGLPRCIYTDNGSDFRSRELRTLVEAVGIRQAFSRAYSPEGRGIIERMFRTIKEMVMPRMPGYRGNRHAQAWAMEDLLTAEQVEEIIWRFVDRYINQAVHSATGRCPAEHYDALIGARDLAGLVCSPDTAASFMQLLPVDTRILQPFGIEWGGLPCWTARMSALPYGTEVHVHSEPLCWRYVYVSVLDSDGQLRYLGRADSYDINRPPPDIGETRRLETAWTAFITEAEAGWTEGRMQRAIINAAQKDGTRISDEVASGVEAHLASLAASAAPRLIPPRTPADEDSPTTASPLTTPPESRGEVRSGNPSTRSSRPRRSPSANLVNPLGEPSGGD
jgi:transposase InsO family protein